MTARSHVRFPAAVLMVTALSWGFNAHAAGLGVGGGVGVGANVGVGTGYTDVRTGARSEVSSDARARAAAGDRRQSDARYENGGRSGAALSAISDARAEGTSSVGSQVRSAVSVDGKVRAQAQKSSN